MKDIRGNPCRWLEIDFLVNKKKYFFSTSLTSSVKCSPNKLISGGKHSCRTLHKKLLKYFGKGHQDALLAEIIQRCQITPIKEDYESIWSFIHEKVTAKISSTNLWTEIHC